MHTTVESVLQYGYDTYTLIKTLLKQLDGTYTRLLRIILNVQCIYTYIRIHIYVYVIHWYQKVTNQVLYGAI